MMLDIIGIALFSNFLTGWFTPLDSFRDKIVTKAINTLIKIRAFWALPLITIFTCAQCLAFWGALIYTQNFTLALICSFLSLTCRYVIKKHNEII